LAFLACFGFSIRGGNELHRVRQDDFTFGTDFKGQFVEYHEWCSKNGKASMKKFQLEHFHMGVKNYKPDVVVSFEEYILHLPEGTLKIFFTPIPALRSPAWYSKASMGVKPLKNLVKEICVENGLDPDSFSNKFGRTTLVTSWCKLGCLLRL
jgi:hypothetical protein